MNESYEIELMSRFLNANYPIYRAKLNMRFKRSVLIRHDEVYFISDEESLKKLYFRLLDILKVVFYTDKKVVEDAVKKFLHVR